MPPSTQLRQLEIINRLKKSSATYAQITKHLYNCAQLSDVEIKFSERTLQRDIKDIETLYNIRIKCNRKNFEYEIKEENETLTNQLLFEAHQQISVLHIHQQYKEFIEFEPSTVQGIDHFLPILNAIKNNANLSFQYNKSYNENALEVSCEPYLLKQNQTRWYLIAKDITKQVVVIYALDRMQYVEQLKTKFKKESRRLATQLFQHCFGIFSPNATAPTKVVLSFYSEQKPYLLSKPIHKSQKIIHEDEHELQVEISVFITYDFIRYLLSYGDEVEIIKPASLRSKMKKFYLNAASYYTSLSS